MLLKKFSLSLIAATVAAANCASAFAQCNLAGTPTTGLRAPLVSGQQATPPLAPAAEGQALAPGDGSTPVGIIPGHTGPTTLLPWIPAIPVNDIQNNNSGISLGVAPAIQSPPGVLGPLLTPVIPHSASTPGTDPGSLTAPAGSFNPADQLNINATGGIPGEGGFCTTIPTVRRGGQESHQWELRGRNSSMAGIGGDGSQDQVTRLGPMAGWGMPFGVPTGDGLRNSSIDLGGGQRMQAGGTVLSTGSSVQDFGLSAMRNNPIAPLRGHQSTEFGQGRRRLPIYSANTTNFGLPYQQFSPSNVNGQKTGQMLLPTAVLTNF